MSAVDSPPSKPVSQPSASKHTAGVGLFRGVFAPSIIAMLGVILYLRLGYVLGQAGLGQTLLIVIIAHVLTITTGLSLSTVATQRNIGAESAYFLICRSLGAPAGAAIGIPLFLAQALSISFYIVGFTESMALIWPQVWSNAGFVMPSKVISSVVLWLLALVIIKIPKLVHKTYYIVIACVSLSLIAFFLGSQSKGFTAVDIPWWRSQGAGFGAMFALFFPAVTGIMTTVGMAGNLKNSRQTLPMGILVTLIVSLLIYLCVLVSLVLRSSSQDLREDLAIFWTLTSVPLFVYIGIWGTTWVSALGSFLTAPRTLQALALDRLVPPIFAQRSGSEREPRVAVFVTLLLAQTGILIGGLDTLAIPLAMVFLAIYGFSNLVSGIEKWTSNPSFRPTFSVPAVVSLLSACVCFYIMSMINLIAMVAIFLVCTAIYVFVQRSTLKVTWGDTRHGIWSALVRTALVHMRKTKFHPATWRPNLLILGGNGQKRQYLLEIGNMIVQERGIVTYMHLIEGRVQEKTQERRDLVKKLETAFIPQFPQVFFRVDIVSDLYQGMVSTAQSYGLGNFEANTIMLGWPKRAEVCESYIHMLRELVHLDRSLILVHYDADRQLGAARKIQIWWGGLQSNGGFMLLLAFLIVAHPDWQKANIEIMTIVRNEEERNQAEQNLRKVIASAHLNAEPRVLLQQERSIREMMSIESQGVDVAIVGIRLPEEGEDIQAFFTQMNDLLERLPTTLLVHSDQHFQTDSIVWDRQEIRKF